MLKNAVQDFYVRAVFDFVKFGERPCHGKNKSEYEAPRIKPPLTATCDEIFPAQFVYTDPESRGDWRRRFIQFDCNKYIIDIARNAIGSRVVIVFFFFLSFYCTPESHDSSVSVFAPSIFWDFRIPNHCRYWLGDNIQRARNIQKIDNWWLLKVW